MSKLIHRQFTHQCAKTPDNIALRSDSENITYRQLELVMLAEKLMFT